MPKSLILRVLFISIKFALLLPLMTGLFFIPGYANLSSTEDTGMKAVVVEDWKVVIDDFEDAGGGRVKVVAHGTNTSGQMIYDCTATISLSAGGEVFPEAVQNIGDVSDQKTVNMVWTVKTDGGNVTVGFKGCPTPRPCDRN